MINERKRAQASENERERRAALDDAFSAFTLALARYTS
jgi:hypothetical protein